MHVQTVIKLGYRIREVEVRGGGGEGQQERGQQGRVFLTEGSAELKNLLPLSRVTVFSCMLFLQLPILSQHGLKFKKKCFLLGW